MIGSILCIHTQTRDYPTSTSGNGYKPLSGIQVEPANSYLYSLNTKQSNYSTQYTNIPAYTQQ